MKIFLGVLSALSLLLAAERFYASESAGHDFGAVFFLFVGIQLLIVAVMVHKVQQERTPKSSALTGRGDIPGLCPACGLQNVPTATRCGCSYPLLPVSRRSGRPSPPETGPDPL